MKKINSVEDLRKAKEKILAGMHGKGKGEKEKVLVRVHCGTSGLASGAKEILDFLTLELEKRNIDATVIRTGDMGYCYAEPTIEVTRPGESPVVFGYVDKIKADEIIEKFIKNGDFVDGIIPVNYRTID
ncbi:MAG: (2Fe-2S) ferredoxin domain-containing protein [Bacteroidales bacterium]|nr:(2Fe-2S) ferredoxin domain-containing protein [Bacteroidales bacterium]